ncbi:hypothetical protein K474DRAFT_408639 [Panus rudis PR-1116 ss-1]|nr:hypothetical protein K474DRAFT_408639 [Panus rudis PR-1116 ss-1]
MQTKAEERRRLQNEVVFVSALRSSIEEREPEIEAVKTKLGALATVWAAIAADSQALLEKLEAATDSESLALFKLRVKTAEEMYRKLQTALEAYKDIVADDSGPVKKAAIASKGIIASSKV